MAWVIVSLVLLAILAYLALVNYGMQQGAAAAYTAESTGWSDAEIQQAADEIGKSPVDFISHLPPAQDRRYIVVGGSGFVGGWIVRHLLARGQSPQSIRIVDLREPRTETSAGADVAQVEVARADITSLESTLAAFDRPWPGSVADRPLTVFHVAAIIRPCDRSRHMLQISEQVNVQGTSNVIEAAKRAGADVLVATSSSTIDVRPVNFWLPIDHGVPRSIVQVSRDADGHAALRSHQQYFSNYGYTKAKAELLVLRAHGRAIRTGCIRASVVYGGDEDLLLAPFMRDRTLQTWFGGMHISCAHVQNISMAHLLYERALLSAGSTSGGLALVITDPGPTPTYGDMYRVLQALLPGFQVQHFAPLPLFILAHVIEQYTILRSRWPYLRPILPELPLMIGMLQPAVFSSCNIHQLARCEGAAKPVEAGGIGYKGACTTLQGMCMQFLEERQRASISPSALDDRHD